MKRKAAAIGMFDGVHLGHRSLLENVLNAAESRGLQPSIVTFSEHPMHVLAPERAPRMLTDAKTKCALLRAEGIENVLIFDFDEKMRHMSAYDFMKFLKDDYEVDCLVVGFNHRFGHDRLEGYENYKKIGVQLGIEVVKAAEYKEGYFNISSSSIREALGCGDIALANAMLGRNYGFRGIVEHGEGLGHAIGFPTANVKALYSEQLVPSDGVYAAWVTVDGKKWPAMVNIGRRPTIGEGLKPTIEANIIGFKGDLYGKEIDIEFVERLRQEKKFDSLDDLSEQLAKDQMAVISLLDVSFATVPSKIRRE